MLWKFIFAMPTTIYGITCNTSECYTASTATARHSHYSESFALSFLHLSIYRQYVYRTQCPTALNEAECNASHTHNTIENCTDSKWAILFISSVDNHFAIFHNSINMHFSGERENERIPYYISYRFPKMLHFDNRSLFILSNLFIAINRIPDYFH